MTPAVAAAAVASLHYRRSRRIKILETDHAQQTGALTQEIEALRQEIDLRDAEAQHLVEHRLPAVVVHLWRGQEATVPGLLHAGLAGTRFADAQDAVVRLVADAGNVAGQWAEKTAQAAAKEVSRSVQALVNEQQRAVSNLLERHDNPLVLADAMAIDHASGQLGRRAQVLGMLTGSWPGRQRVAAPVLDVVRAGAGRIRDYGRVEVIGELPLSVVSRAVEPVALAVAELLDNAARHSEPSSKVMVGFARGNGVSIVIDDAGVGLKPEDRAWAARFLPGQEPVLLTQLRHPFRLGFAAVGMLAARYGFRASVDTTSPFGGTRAVIYLPEALLTASPEPQRTATPAPIPEESATQQGVPAVRTEQPQHHPEQAVQARPDGLLQRRRRQPQLPAASAGPSSQTPTKSGSSVGAFVRGRRAAQSESTSDERNA
ncbi:ATP-binding protein [Streptomyces malaysiensis]|uniref:ATP-binding protein n=1 Tax=Streptomyces malaysiensis TaxID=92644 RepID=UPI00142EB4E3|nr:ATP-binding protein [Streptomyces malaysiensis]